MKMNFRYIILILLISCTSAETKTVGEPSTNRNSLQGLLTSTFSGDSIKLEIQGLNVSDRYNELNEKFTQGVQENYDWFLEYQKIHQNAGPLPYHQNLGLTKDEYKEFQTLMNSLRFKTINSFSIGVLNKNGIISFQSTPGLEIFDDISIDLSDSTASFNNYILQFDTIISVVDSDNAWGQSWSGYKWNYSKRSHDSFDDFKSVEDIADYSSTNYSITIGILNSSNEAILMLEAKEIQNGQKVLNFDANMKLK